MSNGWRCIYATVILLFCSSASASAHRLDEYLQAVTFSIGRDNVAMRMRLAAGVAVASKVLANVDRDGNGILSDAEQRDYAQQVIRDLTFQIDGRNVALLLASKTFPTPDAMKAGLGDIVLEFSATLPQGPSARTLRFENRHQGAIAVYLVNSLVPDDSLVRISGQDRNFDQSLYRLVFSVAGEPQAERIVDPAGVDAGSLDRADRLAIVRTYFVHGVRHILTGYDHLLFAIGLLLAAASLYELVKVVTAFTIAHSLTVALAALGLAHLPEYVVEPVIAASIVFVAVQNIFWPNGAHGWSRLAVAFVFGLFHGLAFAGGLIDLMHGMQRSMILLAILGFSLGVEVGHQIVLLPLFAALSVARGLQPVDRRMHLSQLVRRFGSAGIAVAGAYYFVIALIGTT